MSLPVVAIKDLIRPVQKWSSGEVAGDFTYIDLASVDQTAKTIEKPKRLRVADAPSRARQLIQAGDVLVSTVRPNLNAVALVSSQFSGATASTGFCVLRPNSFMLHGRYLFHWVKNPRFVSGLMSLATGASYPAVSDKQIKGTTIPLPPLAEQRRIAEVLDRADALRAKRRAALAQLDELTQSIFLDTFGTKRDWPSRWPQGTVAEAGTVQLGRQRSPKYQTGRFSNKYLRVANVYENRIDLSGLLSMDFGERDFANYRLEYGDVLLNEGQSTELVGRPAMWRNEIPDCCFQNTLLRFKASPAVAVPEFALGLFLYYFRAGEFARVSSKTSNVAHLSAGRFSALPFPIPPLSLQESFRRMSEKIRIVQSVFEASLIELDLLIASLQHRAFRGEL